MIVILNCVSFYLVIFGMNMSNIIEIKRGHTMGIEVSNLVKKYNNRIVLDSINLSIDIPGTYLIAGPNGSGKSTLLEIIVGLRNSDSGTVKINQFTNHDIQFKKYIGFLTQQNTLRRNCTVAEELQLIKDLFGLKVNI